MDGRDRKEAMDSCGIELCDFHLINVDCSNSALEIWLGSRYFSPTASGRARVTPASGPEARCSLLSTIRAAYTELHCLRTVCNHRRLMKLSDPNVNLSVLIWQFHILLPSLSESRRPTIYYAMQYSTFLNLWSLVLGSCKSLPHSVTMAILFHFTYSIPTVPFSLNISPYICNVISYFPLSCDEAPGKKWLQKWVFSFTSRLKGFPSIREKAWHQLSPWWLSIVARIPHTSAWQSRDPRNRCRDVLWLSWLPPTTHFLEAIIIYNLP